MIEINVIHVDGSEYIVSVRDEHGATKHRVTMTPDDLHWLATEADPLEVLEKSFHFLLEREPKEAILSRFDLPLISHYYPEYLNEIRLRLDS